MEKEKKKNCRCIAAECPAAAMFVLFVPSTRIFPASESSLHGARISQLGRSWKILALGPSTTFQLHVN